MRAMVWAAIAVALAGCAAQEDEPETTADPTPPTLEAPPEPPPEELAVEAYRNMWEVVVEGSHEGADDHPDLELYASGQALEFTTEMLRGVEATGEPVLSPEVADTDLDNTPNVVNIEDCVDSSEWLLTDTDGNEVSATEERKRPVEATVLAGNENWRVDDLWLGDYGSC